MSDPVVPARACVETCPVGIEVELLEEAVTATEQPVPAGDRSG